MKFLEMFLDAYTQFPQAEVGELEEITRKRVNRELDKRGDWKGSSYRKSPAPSGIKVKNGKVTVTRGWENETPPPAIKGKLP